MPAPRPRSRRARPTPSSVTSNDGSLYDTPMPGSFIDDFVAPRLRRSLVPGEIIDLTEGSTTTSNLITSTSALLAETANIAAMYGLQRLNEQNIPSHISSFILASSQKVGARAAQIDWVQVSRDVVTWVQEHPKEAKVAGYVIAGGAVFFKPKLLPKLAWEAWKVREGGLGALINPFSGLSAGVGLATSAAAAVLSALNHGNVTDEERNGDEDGEEESDFAVLTQAAYKLAMRKLKRARRDPGTRRRRL